MKLGGILVLWSSVAAAAPDVCATATKLKKPDVTPPDPRVTIESPDNDWTLPPTAVKFCQTKDTCKSFPLKGLRGGPPDKPLGYLNKDGTLGALRWIANDAQGWHDSLRLFNLKTGKQVKDLTTWKHGGWVELTANRFVVDQNLFDPDGKPVGNVNPKHAMEAVSPDETLVAFSAWETADVTLFDLATGKQKGVVKTGLVGKGPSIDSLDNRFTADSKTLYVVTNDKVAVVDVATLKLTGTQACPP
jgi:hypothetical protein